MTSPSVPSRWSLFLVCFFPLVATPVAEAGLFTELKPSQVIEVEVSSFGCFHAEAHRFIFRRSGGLSAEIAELTGPSEDAPAAGARAQIRKPLGTVSLTDAEAGELDQLMERYGALGKGGCTTVERIILQVLENGAVVSRQEITDPTCSSRYWPGVMLWSDVIQKCVEPAKPRREVRPEPWLEIQQRGDQSLQVARGLPGFDRFTAAGFRVERANVGGTFPHLDSMFASIKSGRPRLVDASRWYNPLINDRPSLSWDEFLKAHAIAEGVAAKLPWLAEWKKLGSPRSLELQLVGEGNGLATSDLEDPKEKLALWRHAGLRGSPTHLFLARWHVNGWFHLLVSEQDNRVLIDSATLPGASLLEEEADAKRPTGPDLSKSPLERVALSWHPAGKAGEAYSRYGLVHPDGRLEIREFVARP